jgi:hypothetical protein
MRQELAFRGQCAPARSSLSRVPHLLDQMAALSAGATQLRRRVAASPLSRLPSKAQAPRCAMWCERGFCSRALRTGRWWPVFTGSIFGTYGQRALWYRSRALLIGTGWLRSRLMPWSMTTRVRPKNRWRRPRCTRGLAPGAREDRVRSRRRVDACARPLNFTVRRFFWTRHLFFGGCCSARSGLAFSRTADGRRGPCQWPAALP